MAPISDAAVVAFAAMAQSQGFITHAEICAILQGTDRHSAKMDALCIFLQDLGIEVVTEPPPLQETPPSVAEPYTAGVEPHPSLTLTGDLPQLYMAEISQVPPLTAQEEIDLSKAISQGQKARHQLEDHRRPSPRTRTLKARVHRGRRARRRFIEANLRLVPHIAWSYRGQGVALPDLIQEGNTGLIKAVERWDYRQGCRFSAYAVWWIRQRILRAIDDSSLIRLPPSLQTDQRKAAQAAAGLKATPDAWPTVAQIAEALRMSPERVQHVLGRVPTERGLESLPCWTGRAGLSKVRGGDPWVLFCPEREEARRRLPLTGPDDDWNLPPCLGAGFEAAAPGVADCFDYFVEGGLCFMEGPLFAEEEEGDDLLRETLAQLLDTLPSRQRRVLTLRYGLESGRPKTVGQVSRHLGVPEERIRQIEAKALRNLRHPTRSRRLRHYLS